MESPLTTIRDLVARLDEVDDGDRFEVGPTLFARPPWGPASEAAILREDEVNSRERPGLRYLLEVSTAREVLAVWSSWRDGRAPTADEAAAAVIHYAMNDAYQPTGAGQGRSQR